MTSFPLYDTLYSSVQSYNTPIDKPKLIRWIHSLDHDGKNKIYALIRYFCIHQKLNMDNFILDTDLNFDLDKFPNILQHILFEFTKLHIQHMKDSQKIEKMRKKSS